MRIYFLILLLLMSNVACVSKEKFEDLNRKSSEQDVKIKALETQLGLLQKENELQKIKIDEQNKIIGQLERKLGLENSNKESLTNSISQMKKALHEMSQNEAETKKRIQEYKDLLARFKSLIDAGALNIKFINGKMVVALSSDILFSSGSSILSPEGKKAIQEVGTKLASIPSKEYQIEGHTDNVPIHNERFSSNWELASARATSVVKELLTVGVPKERVSAASYADSKPVKPNDTNESKAANRRIEIVVVPDLSKLPGYNELTQLK